ncbi:SDR family NAD(P)-dependent oxidoreductase [uncultured Ilumatobacter sp.]|jgi:NAD(P)-dependent dehydrogenase (short-subunit alcohol dehydrogenase family)|uniref:SDR family NAD(P)-dependent oxidoreductase n=1 Tax=uncultured Ilumatobacter sp. TaxID=879968 RepID=UPI00374EA9CC|tara:strand:+ start:1949 stop:2701 length:753 start_codon:yes stop_codon:yes gene_type:complete
MSNITWSFADRVVAITGSAIGMGEGAVETFAAAGASVYGLDVDAKRGRAVAERTGSTFVECDVTSSAAVLAAFEQIATRHQRLDVLINNAGGFWEQNTTESISEIEWDHVIDLNLKGVFLCARHAIPLLRQSSAGRIITISSLAGQTAIYQSSPAYAAAKAGVLSLTRVLASELGADGITSNAIAPSAVLTERIKVVRSAEERAATAASIPLGRYGGVDDLVTWMMFLASEEGGYMTGETIAVNGGRFMS